MTAHYDPPAMSWGELANLTHAHQLELFGFCGCEDGPAWYGDCPVECYMCGNPVTVCAGCGDPDTGCRCDYGRGANHCLVCCSTDGTEVTG